MNPFEVVLIPGDGIGPEVTDAASRILEAAGAPLVFQVHHAGLSALEQGQEACSSASFYSAQGKIL